MAPCRHRPARATTMGASGDRGSAMGQEREAFAAELRLLRASSGLSLGQLAQAAHVNRGYVGHVEHGQRWPSRSVAAALDAAVGADGALLGVWTAGDAAERRAQVDSVVAASRRRQLQDSEVALMSAADESAHFPGLGGGIEHRGSDRRGDALRHTADRAQLSQGAHATAFRPCPRHS